MLRINVIANSAAAESYYVSSADYYLDEGALPARWQGKGAELLGLHGEVAAEHFAALCRNRHPQTGSKLTAAMRPGRRSGYDFTFTASKSTSIMLALARDDRIIDAFRQSVNETMQLIEQDAAARVRKGGKDEDRATGNLVWGEFIHTLSRPVGEEGIPQPALHAHVVVQNASHDHKEGTWKALQAGGIKAAAPYFQAVFRAKLAERLQHLGYELDVQRGDFEIKGVPASAIRKLSKRTEEIEALAKRLGVTNPKAKAALGRTSRKAKHTRHSWEQLRDKWRASLTHDEIKSIHVTHEAARSRQRRPRHENGQAFQLALDHLLERQSAVPERTLLAEALRRGLGSVTLEGLQAELLRPELRRATIEGLPMVTTHRVMDEERELVAIARGGRGSQVPLGNSSAAGLEHLNAGQRAAVDHLLSSRDQFALVRGVAGSGKTTLLRAARRAIEQAGLRVTVLAPTAAAARVTLRNDGIAEADTLQRFLNDEKMQRESAGQLVLLDEGSLAGMQSMLALARLSRQHRFRVGILGDPRQHKSVARGNVLAVLEEFGGVRSVEVSEIIRQQGNAKAAVELLAKGKAVEAFDLLDRMGAIVCADHEALADRYVAAMHEGSVLAVAPTHAEGGEVTAAIRSRLKCAGTIQAEERAFMRLAELQTTESDRRDPSQTNNGFVAEFLHHQGPYKNGERVLVTHDNQALLRHHATAYRLFRKERIGLSVGDRIRITKGGKTLCGHRLDNGATYTIRGFTADGDVELGNGWRLGKSYGHIAHDWVVTSFASQSRTVDTVIVAQGEVSLPATTATQFYVAASRARKSIVVFTNCREKLRQAVARPDNKAIALPLARSTTQKARSLSAKIRAAVNQVRLPPRPQWSVPHTEPQRQMSH